MKQLLREHKLPRQYANKLLVMDSGDSSTLQDISGKRYLDFAAGIAVNSLGNGNKDLARIIAQQAEKLIHTSNLFTSEATLELAENLTSSSPLPQDQPWSTEKNPGYFAAVHFGNSGSEANEAAVKYARVWHKRTSTHTDKHAWKIIAFENGFHGRTMGSLSLTHNPKYRLPFEPLVPGTIFAKFNDYESLEAIVRKEKDDIAAILVEPVQGEGGLNTLSPKFARFLNELAQKHNILLIADEVQSGLGRCATLFASEKFGLEPNIITLSKPLAAGLPLSATLIQSNVNSILQAGDHGTTFGGGPLSCAAANFVWNTINSENFLLNVQTRAHQLETALHTVQNEFPAIFEDCELKGTGLLRGIVLRNAEEAANIIPQCQRAGLLILRSGTNVLRLAPPLTISEEDIQAMQDILRSVLRTITET